MKREKKKSLLHRYLHLKNGDVEGCGSNIFGDFIRYLDLDMLNLR